MNTDRARRVAAAGLAALLLAGAFAGCGGGEQSVATVPPASGATSAAAPPLLRAPPREGEIVVEGEGSPASHGPYEFSGRYRVQFAQYAPEDPSLDFGAQTAFAATLGPARPGPGGRYVRLFERAARGGRRTLELRGEHVVEIEFGDFPYVVRFTPVG